MFGTQYRLQNIFVAIGWIAFALLSTESLTASETKVWQKQVAEDIWLEHACKVAFFSHIVERETDSGKIVMVKVHCDDNRSFDSVQSGADTPFKFSERTPREKKSC